MVYSPVGTPTSAQVAGDCAALVCDGQGVVVQIYEPMDIQDDANECTTDSCTVAGTVHAPKSTGTACSTRGTLCSAGACVPFIQVKCQTASTLYTGCDGVPHPGVTIVWGGPSAGQCLGVQTDAAYCPPGTQCGVSINSGPVMFGTCQ